MTMLDRNRRQLEIAQRVARRRGIDLLEAITLIATTFAAKYPPLPVPGSM